MTDSLSRAENAMPIPELIEETKKDSDGKVSTLKYIRGKLLGKGGFAKCFQTSLLPNKSQFALKIVSKATLSKSKARQKLYSEIRIHRTLRHQFIVKFERFFEDDNFAFMLLELCPNNSMSELLKRRKRVSEPEIRCYMSQLICSLKYLRENLIIHRDLKLGNLFLDSMLRIKVGDFGLAARLTSVDDKRRTICGTPNYIAPEIIEGKEGHSFEVDTWSAGVIMYTLLIGKPPFESKDVKSTYKRILSNNFNFPDHIAISEEAKHLIQLVLQTEPTMRPNLDEILQHTFFTHPSVFIPQRLPDCALYECPTLSQLKDPFVNENVENSLNIQKTKNHHQNFERKNLANIDLNRRGRESPLKQKDYTCSSTKVKAISDVDLKSELRICAVTSNLQGISEFDHENREHLRASKPQTFSKLNPAPFERKKTDSPYEKLNDLNVKFNDLNLNVPSSHHTPKIGKDTEHKMYLAPNTIEEMHHTLESKTKDFIQPNRLETGCTKRLPSPPSIWVVRYYDYTSKYGLGFLLNTGSAGVYFNDSSKIILSSNGETFRYMERAIRDSSSKPEIDQIQQTHKISKYPVELHKKVTLLSHFKNYLMDNQSNCESTNDMEEYMKSRLAFDSKQGGPSPHVKFGVDSASSTEIIHDAFDNCPSSKSEFVYLKKWVRTRHAIFFRLSNKTVQVVFFDRSEILLSAEAHQVTFLSKQGERFHHSLEDIVLSGKSEIIKRIKYTKDIMFRLISTPGKS